MKNDIRQTLTPPTSQQPARTCIAQD